MVTSDDFYSYLDLRGPTARRLMHFPIKYKVAAIKNTAVAVSTPSNDIKKQSKRYVILTDKGEKGKNWTPEHGVSSLKHLPVKVKSSNTDSVDSVITTSRTIGPITTQLITEKTLSILHKVSSFSDNIEEALLRGSKSNLEFGKNRDYHSLPHREIESCNKSIRKAHKNRCQNKKQRNLVMVDSNAMLLVNPDCFVQILLDYLHEVFDIDKNVNLDLSDENGILMNLHAMKPYENASKVLMYRRVYILIKIEFDLNYEYSRIEPLIKKTGKSDAELYNKLKRCFNSLMKMSDNSIRRHSSRRF